MEDLREKLKTEIDHADWSMLKPHFDRGTLLKISPELDILDVAVAIAEDKAQIVKLWLDDNLIMKSDDIDVTHYEKDQYKKQFRFIIIQPYVLVQVDREELN